MRTTPAMVKGTGKELFGEEEESILLRTSLQFVPFEAYPVGQTSKQIEFKKR
jgi:hypothetical protein